MTGYGSARVALGDGHLSLELRSVNHRFMDVKLRVPPVLGELSAALEASLRKRLVRGRVDAYLRLEGVAGETVLNRDRARKALTALAELRDELDSSEAIPLSLLAAVPDLFSDSEQFDAELARDAMQQALDAACERLDQMRLTEGTALKRDMEGRLDAIEGAVAELEPLSAQVVERYRDRLKARLERLLDQPGSLDPGRLEQEVVVLADRADVAEELTRLASHCQQFRQLMGASAGGVGRKLDFLLQEMGREINTIGSKVGELDVTRRVLDMKAELERMREQVQNVL